jgi:peptide/nickel transport system substrate-binding protein
VWTNWPTDGANDPSRLPSTWNGYWQMGGLETVLQLQPVE